jgi:hypothetical protein
LFCADFTFEGVIKAPEIGRKVAQKASKQSKIGVKVPLFGACGVVFASTPSNHDLSLRSDEFERGGMNSG